MYTPNIVFCEETWFQQILWNILVTFFWIYDDESVWEIGWDDFLGYFISNIIIWKNEEKEEMLEIPFYSLIRNKTKRYTAHLHDLIETKKLQVILYIQLSGFSKWLILVFQIIRYYGIVVNITHTE